MAWWNFFGVVNILTEAALIIHPVIIVSPLRTSLGKKIGIVSCFAGRVMYESLGPFSNAFLTIFAL